tara:strand:- start:245 stop:2665 length:2421 start_codon:yes stop_codon:yes gene_type:complete
MALLDDLVEESIRQKLATASAMASDPEVPTALAQFATTLGTGLVGDVVGGVVGLGEGLRTRDLGSAVDALQAQQEAFQYMPPEGSLGSEMLNRTGELINAPIPGVGQSIPQLSERLYDQAYQFGGPKFATGVQTLLEGGLEALVPLGAGRMLGRAADMPYQPIEAIPIDNNIFQPPGRNMFERGSIDPEDLKPPKELATAGLLVPDEQPVTDVTETVATKALEEPEEQLKKLTAPKHKKRKDGTYIGGPQTVTSPQQLGNIRKDYLSLVELGAEGADWYNRASELINLVGGEKFRLPFSGALAKTSQGTAVDPNFGHGIKGHNQLQIGAPVQTGRFPSQMGPVITEMYEKGDVVMGPKIDPYKSNLQVDWIDVLREKPVNDIWQGRAWGHRNPDGSMYEGGFTAAQHEFMNRETLYAAEQANRMKIGGRTDWDPLKVQAAAWAGMKARAGEIDISEAGKSYPDFAEKFTGYGTFEMAPGGSTRHLQGIEDLPRTEQRRIAGEYFDVLKDDQGRDIISTGYGGLALPTIEGAGYWEGETNPLQAARTLVGRVEEPLESGRKMYQIDPASRQLLNVSEATRALLLAQEAGAWNYRALQKSPLSTHNAVDINLGRSATNDEMLQLGKIMDETFGDKVALTIGPNGFRILNTDFSINQDSPEMKNWVQSIKQQLAPTYGKENLDSGFDNSGYMENIWSDKSGRYGAAFLQVLKGQHADVPIFKPELVREGFDRITPPIAKEFNKIDKWVSKNYGLNIAPDIQKVRQAIVSGGMEGLEKLIKTGKLPAVLVALLGPYLAEGLRQSNEPNSA